MQVVFKYRQGIVPNLLAIFYAVAGYLFGITAALSDSIFINIIGGLLLAHAMVIAAYLIHECAHTSIFKDNRYHVMLGNLLMWITGSCYADYNDIQHKHFRHHADKADVVSFDYREKLKQYPVLVRFMAMLEWAYIPAIEIMMHLLVIVLPFTKESRKHLRRKIIMITLIRASIFIYLVSISPSFAVVYPIAYMMFLTILRFMDVHQHTYEIFETLDQKRGEEAKQFDRAYEHRNTFSNLISVKYPILNLLVLNFGYHNAHHAKVGVPWHDLPALHKQLYAGDTRQIFPFINLLISYHHYRVKRMLNADEGDIGINENKGKDFIGVDGVSFLTTH